VPAQVAGTWEWQREDGKRYRVELQQEYQEVTGKAWLDGSEVLLSSTDLRGPDLDLELQEDESAPIERVSMKFTKDRRGQRQAPKIRQQHAT